MRVTLHLTRRCNLSCTYCYADCTAASRAHADDDMTLETAQRGVDLALERSEKRAHIVFFGGEPTLCLARIDATAAYARAAARARGKEVSFELTTNGTRLNDAFFAVVTRHHMVVAVSVDGPRAVHDRHRLSNAGHGTFAAIDAGLDRLLREVPSAIASAVVTPDTVANLSESVAWLLDRGFRIVVTAPNHGADWTPADARTLDRELGRIAALYEERTRRGQRFYLGCVDGAIRTHVRGGTGDATSCGAGLDHVSVAADGTLFPCVQFVSEAPNPWSLGHVTTGLDPARAHALAPGLSGRDPSCTDCALVSRCASGCPCANLAATGRPDRVSPIQCASQRLGIPRADRAATRLYRRADRMFIHKHYNRLYPVAECLEDGLGALPTRPTPTSSKEL